MPGSDVAKKDSIFVPTLITYKNRKNPAEEQALIILNEVEKYLKQGYTQVGITYSANDGQSEKIAQTYQKGGWFTGTNGANQASVMHQLEQMLATTHKHLQHAFRILPITTIDYSGGNNVKPEWLIRDVNNIHTFLNQPNHVVMGWQNEDTKPNNRYALGGGVSKQQLTVAMPDPRSNGTSITKDSFIQRELKVFEQQYSPAKTNQNNAAMQAVKVEENQKQFEPEKKPEAVTHTVPKKSVASKPSSFTQAKKISPEDQEIAQASTKLAQEMKQKLPDVINKEADFLIRKGNINNTFKLGFATAHDAQQFFNHLKDSGFSDVTYFGANERYPMDQMGNVASTGAKYSHVVRFEVPEDALQYFESKNISDIDTLYNAIMQSSEHTSSLRM